MTTDVNVKEITDTIARATGLLMQVRNGLMETERSALFDVGHKLSGVINAMSRLLRHFYADAQVPVTAQMERFSGFTVEEVRYYRDTLAEAKDLLDSVYDDLIKVPDIEIADLVESVYNPAMSDLANAERTLQRVMTRAFGTAA